MCWVCCLGAGLPAVNNSLLSNFFMRARFMIKWKSFVAGEPCNFWGGAPEWNSAAEKNLTCKKISLRKKKATLLVCVELNASAQGCPQWVILFLRCYFMRGKFFIQWKSFSAGEPCDFWALPKGGVIVVASQPRRSPPRNTHPTGFAHKNFASENNLTCKKISLRKKKATLLVCVEFAVWAQGCPRWIILC